MLVVVIKLMQGDDLLHKHLPRLIERDALDCGPLVACWVLAGNRSRRAARQHLVILINQHDDP